MFTIATIFKRTRSQRPRVRGICAVVLPSRAHYRSNAIRPPTSVMSTLMSGSASGGTDSGSPESTARSAHLPGSMLPRFARRRWRRRRPSCSRAALRRRDRLLGRDHVPFFVAPRDRRHHPDQRVVVFDDRRVRRQRDADAGVEHRADRIGPRQERIRQVIAEIAARGCE